MLDSWPWHICACTIQPQCTDSLVDCAALIPHTTMSSPQQSWQCFLGGGGEGGDIPPRVTCDLCCNGFKGHQDEIDLRGGKIGILYVQHNTHTMYMYMYIHTHVAFHCVVLCCIVLCCVVLCCVVLCCIVL